MARNCSVFLISLRQMFAHSAYLPFVVVVACAHYALLMARSFQVGSFLFGPALVGDKLK